MMDFPLYKEWMGDSNTLTDVYVKGVSEFMKYAKKNIQSERIACPCTQCRNGKRLELDDVELHLLRWGMWVNYKVWNFHGEREVPFVPEQLEATETVQVEDNLSMYSRLDNLINVACGVYDIQDNYSMECDGGQDDQGCFGPHLNGGVNEDKEYVKLKADAARPLYPNCDTDHSTLYAMVGLLNLKSRFGSSDNSVPEILKWAKDLLPKDNTLRDNYPYMKIMESSRDEHFGTPLNSRPTTSASPVTDSQESQAPTTKRLVVTFDTNGNPIGENKSKLLTHSLKLIKAHVGVACDDWGKVGDAKRDDIWQTLLLEFDIPLYQKDNLLSRMEEQWKTWKRNIRKKHFPPEKSSQEILVLKDHVPKKLEVPLAEWNRFIAIEASTRKIEHRVQNSINRSKKKDVHNLGAKSYSDAKSEWTERTTGMVEEGPEPTRTNLFLHARRDKESGKFMEKVVETAQRVEDIRSSQDENIQTDLDSDALTQVFGKDKRGRTRGVGSKVSRTKLKHTHPIVAEFQLVKYDVTNQNAKIDSMEQNMGVMQDSIKVLLSSVQELLNRTPPAPSSQQFSFSVPGVVHSAPQQIPSMFTNACQHAPIPAHTGIYFIRNLSNNKTIGTGRIEEAILGTIVHNRPLMPAEVKLAVISVHPGCEGEMVHVDHQGNGSTIGDYVGSYVAWPIYFLEKIV